MKFDTSLISEPLTAWRYTTQPTFNADGTIKTAGVKTTLAGVFILLRDELVDRLAETLTDAEKAELRGMVYRVSTETPLPANHVSAALWNIPLWVGETRGVLLRIPAALWANPATEPPAKVKHFLGRLLSEDD